MSKIAPEKAEEFVKGKWKQCQDFNEEAVNGRFLVKPSLDREKNIKLLDDLLDKDKIIRLISKREIFQHQA
jgi:hypothetical protein